MNPEFYSPPDRHDDHRITQQLCRAVGEADFDYAALVDGVHQRAGRIRRRRALTTGAIVAVFGPALVGGSAVVLPDLLPGGVHGSVTPADTPVASLTEELSNQAVEPSVPSTQDTLAARDPVASPEGATGPPWQETDPPLPADGLDDVDSGNAWEIPDARPTGVAFVDALGPPEQGLVYREMVPISGAMVGNTGVEGLEPVAGQSWVYYQDDTSWESGAVAIVITGWDDSLQAREAIRDDTMTSFVRDVDGAWQQQGWADHEGDDDYLLHTATVQGLQLGFALVRQGDYLIGVTVTDTTGEINAGVAAEIAAKTAENMAALDAVHGRD